MPNQNIYKVLNELNQVELMFSSFSALAKHLGLTVGRLKPRVGDKKIITHEMFKHLERLSYELPDYSNRGQNRKKGVRNK